MENNLKRDVVSFATDSICTTRKLDVDCDQIGEFSFDNSADAVFYLQNGFYRFDGKWKQRGLGKLDGKEIEHDDVYKNTGAIPDDLKRRFFLVANVLESVDNELNSLHNTITTKSNSNI